MVRDLIQILVVDDDPVLHSLIQIILEDARYQPTSVTTLKDALELLSGKHRFQLILCDLSLPDSEPTKTIRVIAKAAPGIPIAAMTGWDDEKILNRVRCQGAADTLLKGRNSWVKELEPFLDKILGLGLAVTVPG